MRRYSQIIGFATRDIAPASTFMCTTWASSEHGANLGAARDYAFCAEAYSRRRWRSRARRFLGIVRADGRVATRNYIGIISTVNCSATVSRAIAEQFHRHSP